MTKNFFTILILLLSVSFFACPPPPEVAEDPYNPGIVYSNDWRFITVFLDADNPVIDDTISIGVGSVNYNNSARALTPDISKPRLEYFEVCFSYGPDTVRSTWEIGRRANIDGVHRTFEGTDYSLTYAGGVTGGAILFAGWKEDKTLLAIGKLVKVDDEETTVIKSNSVHVTFEIFTLTAAASLDSSLSSFKTTSEQDMSIINAVIIHNAYNSGTGRASFPLYILPPGRTDIKANYEFKLAGNYVNKKYVYADWDDFKNSIIVASSGVTEKREARYPAGNGRYWYADYAVDTTTKVKITNNYEGGVLQNPVEFSINTENTNHPVRTENGLFTLAFSIPVYALVPYEANETEMWHIRPGFKSFYYNIDNGMDSTGGGLLIGVDLQDTELEINAKWG